ncbi:uncharacterized protein LOC101213254 isoform X3 [Cucumis sativus]|uniref:uncharacterized protein LOC101213254 isoform X3 n=1 Tax=Cucumis sativus TaxID=3659 RepID=UPI0005ECDF76|nr:uncharacterized protein LOC101213254 isoform X3 [Cucumis sativus]KAE8653390.1 hypothetical protein Csa_007425 [Cucumis sativus]
MFLTTAVYDFTFNLEFHLRVPVTGDVVSSAKRRRALKLVDRALSKRQYKSAVSLVKQLQGKPYGLRGFGAAKQIIKKRLELDESEVNRMDILSLQPLVDSILDSVQQCLQISLLEEILSVEKLESSMAEGRHSSRCEEQEHFICAQHEAGHFLVGYLMGVLPKAYQVPSIQALRQNRFAEGKVSFVGFEFLGEIDSAKILGENADIRSFNNRANKGTISSKIFYRKHELKYRCRYRDFNFTDFEPVFMCNIRRFSGRAFSCWEFRWTSSGYSQAMECSYMAWPSKV